MKLISYGCRRGCGHEQDGETLKGKTLNGKTLKDLPVWSASGDPADGWTFLTNGGPMPTFCEAPRVGGAGKDAGGAGGLFPAAFQAKRTPVRVKRMRCGRV